MMAAVCAAFLAQPLCAQDDALPKAEQAKIEREEKKLAADWVKNEITTLRKTTALIKKVKDDKTAKKANKKLQDMYGKKGTKKKTAMGEAGPATMPRGAAYKEQIKKNEATLTKLKRELKREITRISEIELEDDEIMGMLYEIEDTHLSDNEDFEEEDDDEEYDDEEEE